MEVKSSELQGGGLSTRSTVSEVELRIRAVNSRTTACVSSQTSALLSVGGENYDPQLEDYNRPRSRSQRSRRTLTPTISLRASL